MARIAMEEPEATTAQIYYYYCYKDASVHVCYPKAGEAVEVIHCRAQSAYAEEDHPSVYQTSAAVAHESCRRHFQGEEPQVQ